MRREDFDNKWNQYKWEAKQKWGKLTDEDIAGIHGQFDRLSHKIQERYGWDKKQADREVTNWCAECEKSKWMDSEPKQATNWEGQEEWWKESDEPKHQQGPKKKKGKEGPEGGRRKAG